MNEAKEVIARVWKDGHALTYTEIVRCKDCKFYEERIDVLCEGVCKKIATAPVKDQPNSNDFCSMGERR